MSEKKFQEAKSTLAFSQNLRDQLMGSQAPVQDQQMAPEMAGAADMTPETAPVQDVTQDIQEVMEPYMARIEDMIASLKDGPKETVLKVEGTMEPKDE